MNWVTLDKFAEITGLNRSYILRQCSYGDWPEGHAWDKLSPKIYLISTVWWVCNGHNDITTTLKHYARFIADEDDRYGLKAVEMFGV